MSGVICGIGGVLLLPNVIKSKLRHCQNFANQQTQTSTKISNTKAKQIYSKIKQKKEKLG
jgi:hypothetical protein